MILRRSRICCSVNLSVEDNRNPCVCLCTARFLDIGVSPDRNHRFKEKLNSIRWWLNHTCLRSGSRQVQCRYFILMTIERRYLSNHWIGANHHNKTFTVNLDIKSLNIVKVDNIKIQNTKVSKQKSFKWAQETHFNLRIWKPYSTPSHS